jgi:sugar phosphate isomerase/epimerase
MPITASLGLAAREARPDLSDLADRLDELEDLSLGHVELPLFAADLVIGGRLRKDRLAELVSLCRGRPFGFTIHGPLAVNFMGPAPHLPRFFEATRAFVEVAAAIGAPHLVVHAGMLLPEERHEREARLGRQREWLAKAGDVAADHGVTLCVENLFDFGPYRYTPSLAALAQEIAAIGHPAVRATLDVSHGFIHATQHGTDFVDGVVALAPHAVHLHLHDSFGEPDLPWVYADAEANAFGMGDLHLPVGWGSVPWSAIADAARFPEEIIAIHELNPRFWREREEALCGARDVLASLELREPAGSSHGATCPSHAVKSGRPPAP